MARASKSQTAKAIRTFRSLMAQGFDNEAHLIAAASEALGGDDAAQRLAAGVWRVHFCVAAAN